MKTIWGFGIVATLSCASGLSQIACSASTQGSTPSEVGDPKLEELIGSVPVTSASLDGIGSIGFVYDSGGAGVGGGPSVAGAPNAAGSSGFLPPVTGGESAVPVLPGAGAGPGLPYPASFYAQCTGTLISKSSVLTSRSCGALFQQSNYWATLKFAIGADSTQPTRLIDVVDVEFAPASTANGTLNYPDLAVLHLGESVTDVAVFPVAVLTEDLIGKQLAALGFGNSDLRYQSGTRRAGALTVREISGPLYPAIFGSFEAFYQYELSGGYYPIYADTGVGGAAPAGAPNSAGAGPTPPGGSGGEFGGSGGAFGGSAGGNDDWYRQYLQQQYDNTLLASGEAYLGGTDADAQPCGADQGGPVVRKLQNKLRVLAVFSRSPFGGCDKGGIYAAITAGTKSFIDTAAQWKDPCTSITAKGSCVGTTATRCSTVAEGKRRAVKFDCALLNQVCVGGGDGEVTCTDK